MRNTTTTWLAALALLAGCAGPQLVPAPQAERVPGEDMAAVAHSASVRMVVEADAWNGYPDNLSGELTPLRVSIQNRGKEPLRVRYKDFALETSRGIRYTPLPPLRIEGSVTQQSSAPLYAPGAIHPRFVHSRFFLAPWYGRHYAGLPHWSHPWAYDPLYYDSYYPRWTVTLPTPDMLEQAIPEGAIEAGGNVSGFLYFPDLDDRVERVTFRAELMQGRDGSRLGTLELPFVVR